MLMQRFQSFAVLMLTLAFFTGCGSGDPHHKQATVTDDTTAAATKTPEGPMVTVRVFDEAGELSGPVSSGKVIKTDAEWRELLTDEQFRIARSSGTESAFCGTLLDNKLEGVYTCICCNLPLFSSNSKFKSGTGWPSFFQPIAKENVAEKADNAYGMKRVEITCERCDAHLGHVFEDGPRPTGLRFCLNSESLSFTESRRLAQLADPAAKRGATARSRTRRARRPCSLVAASGASRRCSRNWTASSKPSRATPGAPRKPPTTRLSAPAGADTRRSSRSSTSPARSRTRSCCACTSRRTIRPR